MKFIVLTITLLSTLLPELNCVLYDYYWKDYYGEIPDDAIPGGLDLNSKPTYIAQVYVTPKFGVQPTRLYQGATSVTTSGGGVKTTNTYIRILCSNCPEKFQWIPTTSSKIFTDFIGKHLVVGGAEESTVLNLLNIGRVSYQGEVIVGKVCTYEAGDAKLYFPYKDREVLFRSYEVLVYNNTVDEVTTYK